MDFQFQSPTFRPNDDELERAQSRAARAASIRRKSTVFSPPPPLTFHRQPDQMLEDDQIMDLFQNCIKMASENKINQKNTWELKLIDHLSEIIRFRSKDDNNETNFQKASCSLEAGVKIYSLRVDSVHSEAYKVLGGINRAWREQDEENVGDGNQTQSEQGGSRAKKDVDSKLSPLATLESSYEVLNVKKFDAAFTVDPLYHQTSAQFDEGGAKGLLLNNLGMYGGCRVLFDSFEYPENNILSEPQNDNSEVIDLSFAKENIKQMMSYVSSKNSISPTLRDILSLFDEDNCRPPNLFPVVEQPMDQDDIDEFDHSKVESSAVDHCGSWNFDHAGFNHDDPNDSFASKDANFTNQQDGNGEYAIHDTSIDQRLEKIADLLSIGLGFTSKSNAWAGPEHWKFQKAKGLEKIPCAGNESELVNMKPKLKKEESDLDFTKSLEEENPNIFAPPKNPKSLLLPVNRVPCNIMLPDDCHYRPESLVKLLLLPDVMCLGEKARKWSDESRGADDSIPFASSDDENTRNEQCDIPTYCSEAEDQGTLVRPPRQVNKVNIQYDKVSKQVDVHALKDTLWSKIRESVLTSDVGNEATVSFRQVLLQFSSQPCPLASLPTDISPHLFICLLHLANEHDLSLHDHPTLDELDIKIPFRAFAK